MAKIFTLSEDIKQIARDAIDDLIDQLGKNCRLYYPPRFVPCNNCLPETIGQLPSCRWIDGGPIYFPEGSVCPLCHGEGQRAEQLTEDVVMLLAMTPREFFLRGPSEFLKKVPANIEVADNIIQSKGYLRDLPKILRSREMVVQPELEAMIRWRYVLAGEPVDVGNIIQGRYFVANWRRVGG